MNEYLQGLNDEQRQAVTAPLNKPLKVLAGAGTGKTRVLTTRYIHILTQDRNCRPENILALTFTNKAAAEMKERIITLCREMKIDTGPLFSQEAWIATFHSFCHRLLREHALRCGLTPDFTVYDEAQSWLLYRRVVDEFLSHGGTVPEDFALTDPDFYEKDVYFLINRLKDNLIYPKDYWRLSVEGKKKYYARWEKLLTGLKDSELHPATRRVLARKGEEVRGQAAWEGNLIQVTHSLFSAYQRALSEVNALDFADLIYYTYRLLRDDAPVREKCRRQFAYIMVDEFQDTNRAQFALLRLLAQDEHMSNITVVGDERQAIYGWRNARRENVREFTACEWGGREIELQTNYRSYQQILDLAHFGLKKFLSQGYEKIPLRAQRGKAPAPCVSLSLAQNREEEGEIMAAAMGELLGRGVKAEDIVVLLRSPRWAKPYEEALRRRGIPHRTIGGVGFYDREEVKDILAYLRVIANPYDDLALVRVLMAPPNFCRDGDLAQICRVKNQREDLTGEEVYLYDFLCKVPQEVPVPPAIRKKVERFLGLRKKLVGLWDRLSLPELLNGILLETDYLSHIYKAPPDEIRRRTSNIKKLFSLATQMNLTTAADFISYTEFFSTNDLREGEEGVGYGDAVTIMSVHQAKGLEFPHVFLPNLTDTNFPLRARYSNLDFHKDLGLIVKKDQRGGDMAKFAPHNYDKENYKGIYQRFGITSYKERQREEQEQEEGRLFYVALTRAQEGLYLSCPKPFPSRSWGLHFFREIWEGWERGQKSVGGEIQPAAVSAIPSIAGKTEDLEQYNRVLSNWLQLRNRLPPLRPESLTVCLSVTQVETYRRCPRSFYLRHQLQLPEEVKTGLAASGYKAALLGTLLHRVLEVYHREKWQPEEIGDLLKLEAQGLGLPKPEQDIYLARAGKILSTYLKSPLAATQPKSAHLERAFRVLFLEGRLRVELRGIIDRIHQDEEGRWWLIDYKSNQSITWEQWAEYRRQLQLYALSFQELFPQHGTPLLFIYHLPAGKLFPVDYSPRHLQERRRDLLETAAAIGANHFPLRVGPHCRWCGYEKYCGKD